MPYWKGALPTGRERLLKIAIISVLFLAANLLLPHSLCQTVVPVKKTLLIDAGCDFAPNNLQTTEKDLGYDRQLSWGELMKAGVEAASRKDFQESRRKFASAMTVADASGDNDQVRQSLDNFAWACVQVGDYTKAESTYLTLVEKLRVNTPKSSLLLDSAQLALAKVYRLQGRYAEAAKFYKGPLDARSAASDDLREYSTVLRKLGHSSDAEELENEASWMDSSRPGVHKIRHQYVPKKAYLASASAYRKALTLQIKNVYSYAYLCNRGNKITQVAFSVEHDGRISKLRIVQSSGDSVLDRNALNAVLDGGPYPPMPAQFQRENAFQITFPLQSFPLRPEYGH